MMHLPRWLDQFMRWSLGLPAWLLERLDGGAVLGVEASPERIFDLVASSARHPEAYLAFEEGLHHHLEGELVLAYQRRGRTAFGVGGLNAPPARRRALLRSFVASTCVQGVVRHLLFPLRREELEDARAEGFEPLQVGVEAWIDLDGATFQGKRFEHVRYMRNRARRRGVQVHEVAATERRQELEALHADWLQAKRPSWRMKLLVGSPNFDHPFDRRYFVASDEEGVVAFVTVLPGAAGVWGLDVMCRRPGAPPGSMERLLMGVVETLRGEGASQLSLGACPMAGVPTQGDRWWLRWTFAALFRSRWGNEIFGFKRLYAFKTKFRPRWEPVYFAASPHLGWLALYRGCRMWGLY